MSMCTNHIITRLIIYAPTTLSYFARAYGRQTISYMTSLKDSKGLGSIRNPDNNKRPCFECYKRRIKCDLIKPTCGKCHKKAIQCHFEKNRRFVQYAVSDRAQKRLPIHLQPSHQEMNKLKNNQSLVLCQEGFGFEENEALDMSVEAPGTKTGISEYYPLTRISLSDSFRLTIHDLSKSVNMLNGNNPTSYYFVDQALIFKLFDYFNEVILDQMVPFDNANSPYRKYLVPYSEISQDILITLICIAGEHLYARKLMSKAILDSLSTGLSEMLCLSFMSVSNTIQLNKNNYFENESFAIKCLNLLMQISYSIFRCDQTDTQMRFAEQRNYLRLVNESVVRHNLRFHVSSSTSTMFIIQRLVFNDVFMSSLNDTRPVVPKYILEYLLHCELNQADVSSLLSIIGCPVQILLIIYEIEVLSHDIAKESSTKSDDDMISISKEKTESELRFVKKLEDYKRLNEETINLKDDSSNFSVLVEIYYHSAYILLLRKICHEDPKSARMVFHVDRVISIVTEKILVGSGPDSCIAFPLYIAGREAVLEAHRAQVLNFINLSEWHLNLGSQRLARSLLCDHFWVKDQENMEEVQKKISKEFPFIIY
ncbi:hypothetical protein CANTEDRAFT_135387 [Yamadazyma tenuis ATCC 10573]|uniref:Zn(2)-C6 fungal-type domain-containing protein n=1 Tax=Candida tenuis (strain ATCC 10573 / BCRC 21748 / CBS 615 / JCM 9827 / NBRC 10315 / NRRL Y-1498 / VKM Y-70) TaxID=590646 RepID=G3BAK2_CANTC|nr:uncharacterized protein CANTEDRAFT_135387 [Yamadazyma tenuis ATCC 10573]EGV61424.1 hypothetical protein CANTEDRAFT_135387 [Yamadazyma tenuis ATCC 10573]